MWIDPDYDPDEDAFTCRDSEGNPYPEHALTGIGQFGTQCDRCGAQLDDHFDD